jgi:type II secretory pathway component PulC
MEGDVLVSIEMIKITDNYSLRTLIKSMKEEQEYNALIYRKDTNEHLNYFLIIEPTEP